MARKIIPLDDPKDRKFMEDLFQKYNRLIFATVKKYVTDPDDQKDVVQSVAERLIWYVQKLRGLDKKACNLYIIYTAKCSALDFCKSQARSMKRFSYMEDVGLRNLNKDTLDDSIENYVILREQLNQLEEIWHELPEEDQLLLEGKYTWELSDKELAETLHCKPASVRMKLTRARRRAFQYLSDKEGVL